MPEMILPPFHVTTVKRHQLEFPFALQQELEAYKMFYRHTYGAEVSDADLIREICRFFLATDDGFRQFKLGRSPRPRPRSRQSRSVQCPGDPREPNSQ